MSSLPPDTHAVNDPPIAAYWQLHLCVLLWGFTPILGRAISLDAMNLVLWRVIFALTAYVPVVLWRRAWTGTSRRQVRELFGIGLLVGLHWLAFYGAIKAANASVAVVLLALAPIGTAVVEPMLFKRNIRRFEIIMAIAVLPTLLLMLGGIPDAMNVGVALGIGAALLTAVFGSFNKRVAATGDPVWVAFVELTAAGCVVLLALWLWPGAVIKPLPAGDVWWMICLAIGATVVPFALSIHVLKSLSAYTLQLAVNLEPLYGVLLAAVLFHETQELGVPFYVGMVALLVVVFAHPVVARRMTVTTGSRPPPQKK